MPNILKMGIKGIVLDGVKKRYSVGSTVDMVVEAFVRFLQFVFGIAVIGLYAQDLVAAKKNHKEFDPKWTYATFLGAISSFSALIYLIVPFVIPRPLGAFMPRISLPLFIYDTILSILWLTAFGMFGKMFISLEDKGDKNIIRMRHSVYVDVINMIFWGFTAAWAGMRWWGGWKKDRTQEEKMGDEGGMREV
ncbi:hypothetical protein FQN53_009786 [Emmonsiellopsis sp. PD_33]|nr:hypothetical protein FQN53_009786 [Emmonsiellopsis sp. PD_33]KAK2807631.1 hypothetical protein FQN51_000068 [Onygenales sp. PD_10]